jgi:hypothetical protein
MVNITEGNYTFQFSVENPDYIVTPINLTVTVIKKEIADIQIAMDDNTFLDPTVAEIISNVDGTITVYIDDYYMESLDAAANRTVQLTYNYISVGNHTLKVIMNPANYHIDSKTFFKNFSVLKKPTSIILNVENTKNTDNIIVMVNASAYGNVIVRVGDIEKIIYVSAGIEQQINFGVFKTGVYLVNATFAGDENYMASNASKTFKVLDTIRQDEITISKGSSENIVVNLPADATGTVTVSIAGNDYNVTIVGGVAEVILPDSLKGENSYVITYSGDETSGYNGGSEYFDINLPEFKARHSEYRYLIFCDNVFSRVNFNKCFCRAGYMLRDEDDSGEIYEPKTVESAFLVDCESTFAYLFGIDLLKNEFIWLNQARNSIAQVAGNTPLAFLLDYFHVTEIFSVYDFFELMAEEMVEDPLDAEIVVTDHETVCSDGAEIIREYDFERLRALMG